MQTPHFARIELPNGRVGMTTLPDAQIGNLQSAVASQPMIREGICIVPLGDPQCHPVSWLWSRHPQLAACLPDAFADALIEFSHLPDPFNLVEAWALVLSRDSQVELLQEMRRIEPPEFLPALVPPPQRANASLKSVIEIASERSDRTASIAIRAGLFQMNDCLDQSHSCSQSIEGEGREGDYWHAIMHRREPDYGNAKYWFRQVGRHPVYESLPAVAKRVIERRGATDLNRLTSGNWDPFMFVDLCQQHARDEDSQAALALREIQGWEMALLLAGSAP